MLERPIPEESRGMVKFSVLLPGFLIQEMDKFNERTRSRASLAKLGFYWILHHTPEELDAIIPQYLKRLTEYRYEEGGRTTIQPNNYSVVVGQIHPKHLKEADQCISDLGPPTKNYRSVSVGAAIAHIIGWKD